MLEAYILAGELTRAGDDYPAAFARYEARLKDFVAGKQKSALHVGVTFVPKTKTGIRIRDLLTHLFRGPFIAKLALGDLTDDIDLPDYETESFSPPYTRGRRVSGPSKLNRTVMTTAEEWEIAPP